MKLRDFFESLSRVAVAAPQILYHVVVLRLDGDRTAYGHAFYTGDARTVCDRPIPEFILDDWAVGRSGYVDRVPLSCVSCRGILEGSVNVETVREDVEP